MNIEMFSLICMSMAVIVFLFALMDLIHSWKPRADTKNALASAASKAKSSTAEGGGLQPQAASSFKDSWEALASLATALKDLDRSSRLFVVSLALLALAGAALGVDSISDAVKDAIP